jgi:hypothetical protein
VVVSVGDQSNLTYIYKTSYTAASGAPGWTAFDLVGAGLIADVWFPGSAQGTLTIQNLSTPTYWVAYTCHWTGQKWMCGCRDSAYSQSFWQIQKVQQ